jgi:hypothetical protein
MLEVLKNFFFLMYGKPAIICCFKYLVFLYGSKAITYLNAIL